MYVLFAFLSLIPYLGLTITNKFVSSKINEYVTAVIKGVFYCLCCFILVCALGHVTTLGNVFTNVRATLFLVLNCVLCAFGWVAYFFAMKRSPLGLFNATFLITRVMFANVASIIFFGDVVTNGFKPMNTLIYIIALVALLGTTIATLFSHEAKNYGARWWILGVCFCSILSAVVNFTMIFELPTNIIYEDVLLFYQSIMVIFVNLIAVAFTKKFSDFKKANYKDYLILFLSGVFEVGFYYLFYRALNYENSNVAIVNIIANCGLFLLVELYDIFIKKHKPSKFHLLLFIVLIVSMVMMCLSGIL